MNLLKEWSKNASRNYIKVSNEKLILSLSHTIKLQKFRSLQNTKDKTPSLSQSSVVYTFTCPGCSCNYIGKTEWTLSERTCVP